MDGICTNCGLAYAPGDRECAQCGQEVGDGETRRGWFRSLFRRRRQLPPPGRSATGHHIEVVGGDRQRRVYDRLEDVPAAERARLGEAQDLGEEMLERLDGGAIRHTETTGSHVSITVDGAAEVYTSLDAVPEELRDRIRDALDMVENMLDDDPA